MSMWSYAWPVILGIGAYAVYSLVLRPQLVEAFQYLGKADILASKTGWAWLWAKLDGWKTTILALISGLAQATQFMSPDLLQDMQGLPWGSIFEPKAANLITVVCAFLIPVTHALGLAKAAKTEPQIPEA